MRRRKAEVKSGPTAAEKGKSGRTRTKATSSTSTSTYQTQHPRNNRMNKWTWMAAAIIVAGLAVAVAVIVSLKNRSERANNATSPTSPAETSAAELQIANESSTSSSSVSTTTATTTRHPRMFTSYGTYELIETVPHNTSSFTQGFCIHDGTLYEGTGLYGNSVVQVVDLQTGNTLRQRPIPDQYFGEGLAYYEEEQEEQEGNGKGRLVQITWKEKTGFVYDSETLEVLQTFSFSTYTNEGWGITRRKGESFVVSDGSEFLFTWDDSFTETSQVKVTWQREDMAEPRSLSYINELEWDPFTDTILANIWYQDFLVRIDPLTGFSKTIYDLTSLFPLDERQPPADCLNGIAVTSIPNVIWVTGKQWPNMYKIKLVD